jgi:hypothetical protein
MYHANFLKIMAASRTIQLINARSIQGDGGCGCTTTVGVGVGLTGTACDEIIGGTGIEAATGGAGRRSLADASFCGAMLSFWYPKDSAGTSFGLSVPAPGTTSGNSWIFLALHTGQVYSRDLSLAPTTREVLCRYLPSLLGAEVNTSDRSIRYTSASHSIELTFCW